MIDRYVLPHIGRVPLRSLTITHLEDLYAHLRRSGRQDGGPLAPKTVLERAPDPAAPRSATPNAVASCTATSPA